MVEDSVRTTVTIYGEEYQLKGDLPEEVVQALAHHVDSRMRILASKSPRVSPTRLAVLTALNLTEELFRIQAERDELVQTMQQKWRRRDVK
ncbi:MAG: cell division protein ZapA [Sulfobacillus sp.]